MYGIPAALPLAGPPTNHHFHSHNLHAQHIRLLRQPTNERNSLRDVLNSHHWLLPDRPIGLRRPRRRVRGHARRGVADVNLRGGDVVFAAVERGRAGKARDGVFGHCIGGRV